MTILRIRVPGIPVGQGSKRHVGNGIMIESSTELKPWRDSIIAAVHETIPDDIADDWLFPGPVDIDLRFTFTRPKAHYGTGRNSTRVKPSAPYLKPTKPDLDKLVRAALDAITQAGGVWRDDSQVTEIHATKAYAPRAGITICVRNAGGPL